jgi:DNA-binding CsgD family transcriptional regulator
VRLLDPAVSVADQQVHLSIADTTLRLALSFVLDDSGYRRTHDPKAATVVVATAFGLGADRLPIDVLVVPPFPASAHAAMDAVNKGLARGVLSATDPLRLPFTIEAVLSGVVVVPIEVVDAANGAPQLGPRLEDTLRLVLDGCSNNVIARRLHQSESTVKRDITELLEAFDAHNRAALVSVASRLGYGGDMSHVSAEPA